MSNRNNFIRTNQITNFKHKSRKKRRGCLGCFGYILLIILFVVGGFFAINKTRSKIEEKEQQKLEARFDNEQKLSSEVKLTEAFEKGEISADTYVLQLAYSLYDVKKLNSSYKSDNDIDFAPDISRVIMQYADELSDETLEYIVEKIFMSDIKIGPDASGNTVAHKENWNLFLKKVYADEGEDEDESEDEVKGNGYDITVLDKAILSRNGKFLIWYTETGNSKIKTEMVEELAKTIEEISDDIGELLDIDWAYDYSKINASSYKDMEAVLDKCGIDKNAIKETFPIFIYEPPNTDGAAAWYAKKLRASDEFKVFKVGKILRVPKDIMKELTSVYSMPYIVIKTSYISDMEKLKMILAHELTHHFQEIYYGDSTYNAPGFTSDTVANFVAASITENEEPNTLVNDHANDFIKNVEFYLSASMRGKTLGYAEFVWAKSYADIVENGTRYLKESLLDDDKPFEFLYAVAQDSYQMVLEDLAVRNITKDYEKKGFISTVFPKPKAKIGRYYDSKKYNISPSGLNYYYLDTKAYRKAKPMILVNNEGNSELFIKIIARKKQNYSLVDTLYCKVDEQLMIIDFSEDKYKKYDEIILAFGNWDMELKTTYHLMSVSPAVIDFYETITEIEEVEPWEINGECIIIDVEDSVEVVSMLRDYFNRTITYVNAELDSEKAEIIVDYIEQFTNEANRIGDAFEKFGEVFVYKTIRIYTIPIEETSLSDDEIHKTALDTLPKPKLKIIDKVEDGMHITIGGSIQPFSKTQIISYAMMTDSDGGKVMYRIELEK